MRREIKSPLEADYWILNVRQGMFDPYIWSLYKWVRPLRQFSNERVPMVLVFKSKEIGHQLGFVTQWKIVGPFDTDHQGFSRYPPERKVDLDATYKGVDQQVSWQPFVNTNPLGIVDLTQIYERKDHAIAYAFAQINSPVAKEVQLRVGTDNGVKIWFNGREIYALDVVRELKIDEDTIPVKFEKGRNTLLLKISQETGPWEFVVRVVTPNGEPVSIN